MSIPLLNRVCGTFYYLKICRKKWSIFSFGRLRFAFQLGLLEFGFPILVLYFCLAKSFVGTLIHLILTFSSLESLRKNKPPNIRIIAEAKKIWLQNPSGYFFKFCRINVYGLECFRCLCHEILNRISLTFIPPSWYFTGLIIMVHHSCTYYAVDIKRDLG